MLSYFNVADVNFVDEAVYAFTKLLPLKSLELFGCLIHLQGRSFRYKYTYLLK